MLHIQDNCFNSENVEELAQLIVDSPKLQEINISDMNAKKSHCKILCDAIKQSLEKGNRLEIVIWNNDLQVSPSTAQNFVE